MCLLPTTKKTSTEEWCVSTIICHPPQTFVMALQSLLISSELSTLERREFRVSSPKISKLQ